MFVTAHKQVQASIQHIKQQTLVGAHALAAKAFVKVQIQMDGAECCATAAFAAFALTLGKEV